LYSYNILSDCYEKSGTFQHVVAMAAHIFRMPFAFVSFVNEDSVLIKASVGLGDMRKVDRASSLCSLAILQSEVTVLQAAKDDACLSAGRLSQVVPELCFYAGAPLKTPDGYHIGVMGVADKIPRTFLNEDEQLLETLALIVMEELEVNRR
jgi:GAF domain-containing protein